MIELYFKLKVIGIVISLILLFGFFVFYVGLVILNYIDKRKKNKRKNDL